MGDAYPDPPHSVERRFLLVRDAKADRAREDDMFRLTAVELLALLVAGTILPGSRQRDRFRQRCALSRYGAYGGKFSRRARVSGRTPVIG